MIAAGGVATAFGLLLLVHDPLVYWNDDFELSILPVCADMARAWNHGEFPLLSPYSWICGNLAGEFQYGVFSIFINALVAERLDYLLGCDRLARSTWRVHLAAMGVVGR